MLNVSDTIINASSSFIISVGGMSRGQLAVTILAPVFSFFTTLYSIYKLRALALNRCYKSRYEKEKKEYKVGSNIELKLETPLELISEFSVRLPTPKVKCCQFFQLPPALPGGITMPSWLEYDPFSNILRTKEPIPAEMAGKVLVIQVAGDMGVILEQFDLRIESSRQDADISEDTPFSPSIPTVTSEQGDIKEQVRSGFEKNKKPGNFEMQSWNPLQNSGTRQEQSGEGVVTVHRDRENKIIAKEGGAYPATESAISRSPVTSSPSPWPSQPKPGKPPVARDSPLLQANKRNVPNPPTGSVKMIQSGI